MNKEMTSAEKGRRTKLSQKTVDELIDIIIRKDDIARRNEKYCNTLRINLKALEIKIKDMRNSNIALSTKLASANDAIAESIDKLSDNKDTIDRQKVYISKLERMAKYLFYVAAIEAALIVLSILYMIMF
jgi:hypothetical protein